MENILERLKRGEVIVGDGALGTMLMQRGLKHGEPPEGFNLSQPSILEEIAALYLEAGAEIISTNTFGASPLRLRQFALDNHTENINQKAVDAVRRAVGNGAYISGSVGPSACMMKPLGDTEPEVIFSSYQRQLQALLAAGIDLVCIETMMDVAEAKLAIEAARSVDPAVPIMATMTFGKSRQGFFTLMGSSVKEASAALELAGANIVGSNCGDGMESMVSIARELRQCAQVPIAIQGNAGLPTSIGAELVYTETPEFVAEKAKELLELGVQIIGGCCGTRPEHIKAIRKVVDARG